MRDFFKEGAASFGRGETMTTCPLKRGTAEWEEWRDGWHDAWADACADHPELNDREDDYAAFA